MNPTCLTVLIVTITCACAGGEIALRAGSNGFGGAIIGGGIGLIGSLAAVLLSQMDIG